MAQEVVDPCELVGIEPGGVHGEAEVGDAEGAVFVGDDVWCVGSERVEGDDGDAASAWCGCLGEPANQHGIVPACGDHDGGNEPVTGHALCPGYEGGCGVLGDEQPARLGGEALELMGQRFVELLDGDDALLGDLGGLDVADDGDDSDPIRWAQTLST